MEIYCHQVRAISVKLNTVKIKPIIKELHVIQNQIIIQLYQKLIGPVNPDKSIDTLKIEIGRIKPEKPKIPKKFERVKYMVDNKKLPISNTQFNIFTKPMIIDLYYSTLERPSIPFYAWQKKQENKITKDQYRLLIEKNVNEYLDYIKSQLSDAEYAMHCKLRKQYLGVKEMQIQTIKNAISEKKIDLLSKYDPIPFQYLNEILSLEPSKPILKQIITNLGQVNDSDAITSLIENNNKKFDFSMLQSLYLKGWDPDLKFKKDCIKTVVANRDEDGFSFWITKINDFNFRFDGYYESPLLIMVICTMPFYSLKTLLSISKHTKVKFDINITDNEGNTALHWLAKDSRHPIGVINQKNYHRENLKNGWNLLEIYEAMKLLVDYGIDTTIKNRNLKTALDYLNDPEKIKIIMSNRLLNTDATLFALAKINNAEQFLKELKKPGIHSYKDLITVLLNLNNVQLLKQVIIPILDSIQDPKISTDCINIFNDHDIPLRIEIYGSKNYRLKEVKQENDFIELVKQGDVKKLQKELDNFQNYNDWLDDAFLEACGGGNLEMVKLLLKLGADIDAQGKYDSTGLHCAYHSNNPDQVIKYLINKGADWTLTDKENRLFNMHYDNDVFPDIGFNASKSKVLKFFGIL